LLPETLPVGIAEAIPTLRRRSRGRFASRGGAWVRLVCAGFPAGAAPIAFVVGVYLQTGWSTLVPLVFRPRVGELLVNTVLLVVITIPLCIALGVALAWLTERTNLPGRRWWSLLATAPLAVPAFVHSYAWVSLVPPIHGLFAGVLVSVIAYFPFLYLPVAATLRRWTRPSKMFRVSRAQALGSVFPRGAAAIALAICGGALLVGLHLLAEYGLYAMIRFDTFTTAIFDQFKSTFNGPAANLLAGVLALCCLAMLTAESAARGNARYARVGSGSAREQRVVQLSAPLKALALFLQIITCALRWACRCSPWVNG
jgi:iron(III) transport system permease protein